MSLREDMATALGHPAVRAINFSVEGHLYDNAGLRQIASLLRDGVIGVATNKYMGVGTYGLGRDTIYWPENKPVSRDTVEIVIHESIHALQDLRRYSSVLATAEACAYLGTIIFMAEYASGKGSPSGRAAQLGRFISALEQQPGHDMIKVTLEASKTALRTKAYAGQGARLSARDIEPLKRVVSSMAIYHKQANLPFMVNGISGCGRCR